MKEIIFELTEINPREFCGEQNTNIVSLKKYFPKLKIVARGNTIKAMGEEEILEEFDKRMRMLTKTKKAPVFRLRLNISGGAMAADGSL